MRKYFFEFLFLILFSLHTHGQSSDPTIKTDMPTLIPPSPTVEALMKFTEIPVENYTGTPSITVPIFQTSTNSKDVSINISLNYHTGSNAADTKSSDVGLGWSLFAGGSISRTVIGLPDEFYKAGDFTNKVGLYHNTHSVHNNKYYEVINILQTGWSNFMTNTNLKRILEEYLWEVNEKGKFDTQHDLWQYNFMGFSGKFIIRKIDNQLVVVDLSDSKLKINNLYNSSTLAPVGFEVIDLKGNKYIFNVIEVSKTTSYSTNSYNQFNHQGNPTIFNSAFHLSEIRDANNNILTRFEYDTPVNKEITISTSTKISDMLTDFTFDTSVYMTAAQNFYDPRISTSFFHTICETKKLSQISIGAKTKIEFEYVVGREDENLVLPETNSVYLNSIIVKYDSDLVKKYILNYHYSKTIEKRMFLNSVDFYERASNKKMSYNFEYNHPNPDLLYVLGKDYWGFFNLVPCSFTGNHSNYKEVNDFSNKFDLLYKMILPTKGTVIFNYETNTYSFEGETPIDDFGNERVDNFSDTIQISNNQSVNLFFSTDHDQVVTFQPPLSYDTQITENRVLRLFKNNVFIQNISCPENNQECCVDVVLEKNHQYRIVLSSFNAPGTNNNQNSLQIPITYKYLIPTTKKYILGGGNRISKIGYFEKDVDKYIYQSSNQSEIPSKEIIYSYQLLDDIQKSSGSLISAKPLFYERVNKRACAEILMVNDAEVSIYDVYTDYNLNTSNYTKSSSVGYKYVVVYESGNGYSTFEYTSPIDYSNNVSNFYDSRFEHTYDFDYKRGLLLKEKKYSQDSKILESTSFDYDFEEETFISGLRTYYKPRSYMTLNFNGDIRDCPISRKYIDYNAYLYVLNRSLEYPFATNADPCPEVAMYKYGVHMLCGDEDISAHHSLAELYTRTFDELCCKNINGEIGPCEQDATIGGYNIPFIICRAWCYTGNTFDFINFNYDYKTVGWAKLRSKTTTNYFYTNGSSTPQEVTTAEKFTYNPLNKMIATHQVISPEGEETRTRYTYLTEPAVLAQNRIAEIERIEVQKNGELLQTSQIEYSNTFQGNASYLPQRILTAKGNQALASKVRYNRYDAYGNPLEVQQEDGMLIAYIWGYNHTQVVAKIENCSYQAIPANLITALHQATATGSEQDVLTALDNLRNAPGLSQAMVTTVTHIPLVGMSTLTDPKGVRIKYHYDAMNRLEKVTDHFGNIVTENSYNYRP